MTTVAHSMGQGSTTSVLSRLAAAPGVLGAALIDAGGRVIESHLPPDRGHRAAGVIARATRVVLDECSGLEGVASARGVACRFSAGGLLIRRLAARDVVLLVDRSADWALLSRLLDATAATLAGVVPGRPESGISPLPGLPPLAGASHASNRSGVWAAPGANNGDAFFRAGARRRGPYGNES